MQLNSYLTLTDQFSDTKRTIHCVFLVCVQKQKKQQTWLSWYSQFDDGVRLQQNSNIPSKEKQLVPGYQLEWNI